MLKLFLIFLQRPKFFWKKKEEYPFEIFWNVFFPKWNLQNKLIIVQTCFEATLVLWYFVCFGSNYINLMDL
jgi:hypothetical protein